jgi:hypothetical protein
MGRGFSHVILSFVCCCRLCLVVLDIDITVTMGLDSVIATVASVGMAVG